MVAPGIREDRAYFLFRVLLLVLCPVLALVLVMVELARILVQEQLQVMVMLGEMGWSVRAFYLVSGSESHRMPLIE